MPSIAATITAPGPAAVSITRISGDDSWLLAKQIIENKIQLEAGCFKLAWIVDPKSQERVDQALILAFKAPHSYTGEDVIEIQSHGGTYISERILELCLEAGAKLAKPGEFTERAFLNHKLDLSQAESIMDLIESRTSLASQNALKIFEAKLSQAITQLRTEILDLLAGLTAGIDFPDEVGDYDNSKFQKQTETIIQSIDTLLAGAKEGRILREGFKVAIVGLPNAGKSSLLNVLLEDDRAIVTDIAGTTRDVIEETISIRGLPVVLLDTAGLRASQDLVEQLGIERSLQTIQEADLILHLISCKEDTGGAKSETASSKQNFDYNNIITILESLKASQHKDLQINNADEQKFSSPPNLLKIGSKLDLHPNVDQTAYDLCISSLSGQNITQLKDLIYSKAISQNSPSDIKVNDRQAALLRSAKHHLEHSLQAAEANLAQDFWTIDLKAALEALGEITGSVLTEELLDNIFAKFCIGK